jgi:Tfp pilus assembly protein PilN
MSPIMMMLILLGVMLVVLTVLVIYRSTLEMHEDDQLFLTEGESQMAKEQMELQAKMGKIEPMVRWLGAASAVLLLALVGMWLYTGLNQPVT